MFAHFRRKKLQISQLMSFWTFDMYEHFVLRMYLFSSIKNLRKYLCNANSNYIKHS